MAVNAVHFIHDAGFIFMFISFDYEIQNENFIQIYTIYK